MCLYICLCRQVDRAAERFLSHESVRRRISDKIDMISYHMVLENNIIN